MKKRINPWVIVTGVLVGVAAVALALFGNPKNMGFCIACFLRDIAGALKFQSAGAKVLEDGTLSTGIVQYLRPEIIGLVLGAFLMALGTREFKAKAGSSPATRFILGAIVMIGALAFLGCPLRMVIRMGSGDLNAFVGFAGFALGILIGILFLKKGFTLKRNYESTLTEGLALPGLAVLLLVLFLAVPAIFAFSTSGPGSQHAPFFAALAIALVVGALAQRSRICMVGGMRDAVMFRDFNLLIGFACIFAVVLLGNIIFAEKLGFTGFSFAPYGKIAHSDHLYNLLGMVLVGWGSVLLGGCPLRQLILAGEGNGDSAVTVLGMVVGAAVSHNFGLAGAGAAKNAEGVVTTEGGVSTAGRIAIYIGLFVLLCISVMNTFIKKKEAKK